MGCCGSSDSEPQPPVTLQPLPQGLELTPAGKSHVASQPSGRNIMICGHCQGELDLLLAPVLECTHCKAMLLPGTVRGDTVIKAQVTAAPGVPFMLPPLPGNDTRRILVVPPVKIPPGAVVDVAVGRRRRRPEWQKDIGQRAFHEEGRIINIDMSKAGSIAASLEWTAEEDQAQQQPEPAAAPQPAAPTSLKAAAGGFLKNAASAAATAAASAAADAAGKAMNQAIQKPKSQLLPSNVQWIGPIDVAPVAGFVSSSMQCGCCGANLKPANLSTVVTFRCSQCGVLATIPATDKEELFNVQVPNGGIDDTHFRFRPGGQDERLVAVNFPVRHMTGRTVTIAVPKPGVDWIGMLIGGIFAGVVAVCFILDPVGTLIDGTADAVIDPLLNEKEPDVVGRVVCVQSTD